MAKRRKEKDEEEELDFKLPKFDEQKFIEKEKEKIKATFFAFIFGVFIAFISFGFWALLAGSPFQWTLTFLFGLFTTSWVRYLFIRLKVKEEILERRGMFTSYMIYFLTWLFVLVILVNPPFYDSESPNIQAVALPDMQEIGGTVKIIAYVSDNSGIKDDQIDFFLQYDENNTVIVDDTFLLENNIFQYEFKNDDAKLGSYSYTFKSEDTSGKRTQINGSFSYDADVIKIPEPAGASQSPGPIISYATDIKIDVGAEVDWVYYTVDGKNVNVTAMDSSKKYYVTSAVFEGWNDVSNATVQVYAKKIHYFENIPIAFNNSIVDTTPYYFNVTQSSDIGTQVSPVPTLPQPKMVLVPGFEMILVIISLLAVLLIFKYKKKDTKR